MYRFFYYTYLGGLMKVYVDLVMFVNFMLDFILLLGVSILLKRNVSIKRVILGSFIGGLSIIILFIPMNSIMLFFFKMLTSIIMVLITFRFVSFRYTLINLVYLYILSIFLGGFLYLVNDHFCIKRKGLVFINNGFSITTLFILILSPIVIYLYVKQARSFKNIYNNYMSVSIYYGDKYIDCIGYMDSGNNLSYLNNNVILLDKRKMIFDISKYLYIPLTTVSGNSIIKAFKPDKVVINNSICKKVLVGLIDSIGMDGVDVILNNNMVNDMGGLND